jgi:hypothetical protein
MWKPQREGKKVELGRFSIATNIAFKFCGENCRRQKEGETFKISVHYRRNHMVSALEVT